MSYLLVLGGLALLFLGGENLVRGTVSLARRANVSELVIGLTLIGIGTSIPELLTTLEAARQGAAGLATGTVVGSNIANILLILALAVLLQPIVVPSGRFNGLLFVLLVATLILCAVLWFDGFNRVSGAVLILLLIGYIAWPLARPDAAAPDSAAVIAKPSYPLPLAIIMTLAGVIALVFGARLLVEGALEIARASGWSDSLMGLTLVAVGTSLPELVVCLLAAARGRTDIALGAVIGSSIINIFGIMGLTALLYPFSVHGDLVAAGLARDASISLISSVDIGALLLSVFLVVLFAATGRRIARWEGAVLLAGYLLYLGLRFNVVPVPALLPNV